MSLLLDTYVRKAVGFSSGVTHHPSGFGAGADGGDDGDEAHLAEGPVTAVVALALILRSGPAGRPPVA